MGNRTNFSQRERFRTFGKALELSDDEVAGLILLSGLVPDYAAAVGQATGKADAPGVRRAPADEAEASSVGAERQQGETILRPFAFGNDVLRFLLLRFLPLAVGIAALGLVMGFLGGDLAWVPVTFVALAVCLMLGQGFLLGDPEAGLREFFWVTLFVLLTTPLLHFAPLGMDHYNFRHQAYRHAGRRPKSGRPGTGD